VIDSTVANESADFVDIDGDGRLDLLCGNQDTGSNELVLNLPLLPKIIWQKFTISTKRVLVPINSPMGLD
jgi:hypothetical protein